MTPELRFALLRGAADHTVAELAQMHECSTHQVDRLLRYHGVKPKADPREMKIPDDFAAVGDGSSAPIMARRYGVTPPTIRAWAARAGITLKRTGHGKRILPTRFAALAPTLTYDGALMAWHTTMLVLRRWERESGVTVGSTRPANIVQPEATPTPVEPPRPAVQFGADDAMRHLQRWCPVFRSDWRGRFDLDGGWFAVGARTMTPAEMVARAVRKGFDAAASRRAA